MDEKLLLLSSEQLFHLYNHHLRPQMSDMPGIGNRPRYQLLELQSGLKQFHNHQPQIQLRELQNLS